MHRHSRVYAAPHRTDLCVHIYYTACMCACAYVCVCVHVYFLQHSKKKIEMSFILISFLDHY